MVLSCELAAGLGRSFAHPLPLRAAHKAEHKHLLPVQPNAKHRSSPLSQRAMSGAVSSSAATSRPAIIEATVSPIADELLALPRCQPPEQRQ